MKRATCLRLLVILFGGAASTWADGVDLERHFGGTNNLNIIARPTLVEAWKTPWFSKGDDYPKTDNDVWEKAGQPTIVTKKVAAELSKILLDDASYVHSAGVKYSISLPCVVVAFSQGSKSIDVFFSFEDNSIAVRTGVDSDGKPVFTHADFDPSRPKLVRIIKRMFPADQRVHSLKEKK